MLGVSSSAIGSVLESVVGSVLESVLRAYLGAVFSTVPSVRDFSRTDGRRQGRPSPSFLKTDGMSAVIHRHRAVTVYL